MKKKLVIFLLILILLAINLAIIYVFFGPGGKTTAGNQPVLTKDSKIPASATTQNNDSVTTPPENNDPAPTLAPQNNTSNSSSTAPASDTTTNNIAANTAPVPTSASTAPAAGSTLNIINKLVSWGFAKGTASRTIDTIIIHTSYDAAGTDPFSLAGTIAEYKATGVSPHYVIDRSGNVYRLVADANIAYHAGVAKMPDGRTNVNDFSLGIEVINTQTSKPTDAQYAALKSLISYLEGKYKIKYVLGHSQVAPGRKDDPWNFDWSRIK